MISVSVLGLVLLAGGVGLLVDCQYVQDGDLPLENDNQVINDKLNEIEHLIRSSHEEERQTNPTDTMQWPINREDRRKILERIANGIVRGVPKSETDEFNALLQLINDARAQKALDLIDPNQSIRYDIDSYLPADSPDYRDSVLSKPVNDPDEFEPRMGYSVDRPNSSIADLDDWQQLLMDLLNQTRDEYELPTSEEQTTTPDLDNLNSVSQREIDRLVHRLGQWIDEQASRTSLEEQQKVQQRDDSEDQPESMGRASATYSGSEYIDQPLALVGHQFVQGGAGEGRQLLGPDGTYENVQVVKTDAAIPSYCDPPNPCPLGYTAKDGCLEEFVNSASFSREYQAQQKCSCDNEHSLFNCAASISNPQRDQQQQQQHRTDSADEMKQSSLLNLGNKLDTLARTVQNRFGNLAFVQRIIGKQQEEREQDSIQMDNDDSNSNYLVRSARKLSALDMHHKVELD